MLKDNILISIYLSIAIWITSHHMIENIHFVCRYTENNVMFIKDWWIDGWMIQRQQWRPCVAASSPSFVSTWTHGNLSADKANEFIRVYLSVCISVYRDTVCLRTKMEGTTTTTTTTTTMMMMMLYELLRKSIYDETSCGVIDRWMVIDILL